MPLGMDFQDIAAILTEINKVATGQTPTTPIVDTSSFVSVAQVALLAGATTSPERSVRCWDVPFFPSAPTMPR